MRRFPAHPLERLWTRAYSGASGAFLRGFQPVPAAQHRTGAHWCPLPRPAAATRSQRWPRAQLSVQRRNCSAPSLGRNLLLHLPALARTNSEMDFPPRSPLVFIMTIGLALMIQANGRRPTQTFRQLCLTKTSANVANTAHVPSTTFSRSQTMKAFSSTGCSWEAEF